MKILVVQTGFLGDVILSTPVPTNIRALYPESKITFLTTPAAANIVEHHPAVDRVLIFDKRKNDAGISGFFKIIKILRQEKFDIVFSLHKSWRTSAILLFSGIKERYGFKEARMSWVYTKASQRSDLSHDVLRNLAVLRGVGREPSTLNQELVVGIPEEVRGRIAGLLAPLPKFVAIAPGSVWLTKRWTEEGFSQVIRGLISEKIGVVLVGGEQDRSFLSYLEDLKTESLLIDALGKLSLIESAEVIRRASALIVNDSAPLHLGSAMKTPTVAIFCATVPEFGFGPWKNVAETVGVEGLSCRPCRRHGGNFCPTGTHACRKQLTSKTVLASLLRVMERENDSSTCQ